MPDEMIWPLRGVSKDPNNLLTLGSDGQVMADSATTDARYVKKAGDTMTGALTVIPATDAGGSVSLERYSNSANAALDFFKARGTAAAPAPLLAQDQVGGINFRASGLDGIRRALAYIRARTASGQAAGGYDGEVVIAANASDGAKPAAIIQLTNQTATGRIFQVNADNISIGAGGAIVSQSEISGRNAYYNFVAPKDNATQISVIGDVNATTAVTGPLIGVQGNVVGQCSGESTGVLGISQATLGNNTGVSATASGGAKNTGIFIYGVPAAAGNEAFASNTSADSHFNGKLAIGRFTPAAMLDVNGAATIRGQCDITGNIVSTGTAHSFANNSIPASAISGLTSGGTVTKVSVATVDGVSGTVATDTTTPAISIKLGAIKPSSIDTGTVNADSLNVNNLNATGNIRTVSLQGHDTRLYTINSQGTLVGRNATTNQTLAYLTVDSADGAIKIGTASGTNVSLGALAGTPVVVSGNSYPTLRGTNGQVLTTDGAGTLSWVNPLGATATTIATAATAGSAGSVRWDENFLYIRTATAWKKIPLTAI